MVSAWIALAKEVVALFGGLCLLVNVAIPAATLALQLAVYDAPELLGRWRAGRAQQAELERLSERLKRLERRHGDRRHGVSDCEDATQRVRTRRRRPKPAADDGGAEINGKSALLSQAEVAPSAEEAKHHQQQQRHRLSIYSTVKKPPRPQALNESECDR